MKRTLLIYAFLALLLQGFSKDHPIPPNYIGYYEGAGMGLFMDTDGIRLIDLGLDTDAENRAERDPHFYLLKDEGLYLTPISKDKSAWEFTIQSKEIPYFYRLFIHFNSPDEFLMKIDESPWKEFRRKEIYLHHYLELFQLQEKIDDQLFHEGIQRQKDYDELSSMQDDWEGLWSSKYGYYLMLEDKIITDKNVLDIKGIYRFGEKRDFLHLLLLQDEVEHTIELFLFKKVNDQLLFQRFSQKELVLGPYENAYNQLRILGQKHSRSLSGEKFNEYFFAKYFAKATNTLGIDLFSSLQIQKDGYVKINGKRKSLKRIVGVIFSPEVAVRMDSNSYSLMISLEGIDVNDEEHIQLFFRNNELQFYQMGGASMVFKRSGIFWETALVNLFSFLGIIGIILLLLYRTILLPRKLKQRLSKVQLEGIKSQLNPHFLFNSMASIQSLMNQHKNEEANRYLAELSDLLRYHLDVGAEDLVTLSEELDALEHYCQLEKLRSPFEYRFELDAGINSDQVELPNQILQPLVENAIKHGLRYVENPLLIIRVQKLAESMYIHIIDNGPGISKKLPEKALSSSSRKTHKGLALVEEKIQVFKKKGLGMNLQLRDREYHLMENEQGTRVSLEVPLKY
ncbi:MAG: histidine kinase [Bacteroidota bacterium]